MVGRVKLYVWNEKHKYWASALCKVGMLRKNIGQLLHHGLTVRAEGVAYIPGRKVAA